MPKTYVVYIGRKPGVYNKWCEANAEVSRFPGPCFKGYETRKEAEESFQSYLKTTSDETSSSQPKVFTSSPKATGHSERKPFKKRCDVLQAISDITRENRTLSKKIEQNSQDIAMLLEQIRLSDE